MTLRERIAIMLFAQDDEVSFREAEYMLLEPLKDLLWADGKHFGDCTNEPQTCCRCLHEGYLKEADQILALIKEVGYVKLADDQSLPKIPEIASDLSGYQRFIKDQPIAGIYITAQQDMHKEGWRYRIKYC